MEGSGRCNNVIFTCVAMVSALSLMALSCSSCSESWPYWSNARTEAVCVGGQGVGIEKGREVCDSSHKANQF